MVVAIDGPAGAGKSTVARALARALGFTYLDSGAMYRAVGLLTLRDGGAASEHAEELEIELGDRVIANGEDVTEAIRTPEVSEAASRVATNAKVRAALVRKQRELLADGDWVVEGRDIGTVVAPDARGEGLPHGEPRGARPPPRRRAGHRRRHRAARPGAARRAGRGPRALAAADGARSAVELDTTGLSLDEVVQQIVGARRTRRAMKRSKVAVVGYPERRQVHAGQPAVGHAARPSCTSRPGVTRDRKEVDADWNGLGFTLVDTGGVDIAGERRAGRRDPPARRWPRSTRPSWPCWWSTPARGCAPGDAELARELRGGPVPVIVVANKVDDGHPAGAGVGVLRARPRRADAGVRHPGPRHRRPARPDRRAPARVRRRRGGRHAAGADRAPERRQVVAAQPAARRGARDRDADGRHHARLDRHPHRVRRPARWCWSTPPACAAAPRWPARSTTTPSCARSRPPTARRWRSWSATPTRA